MPDAYEDQLSALCQRLDDLLSLIDELHRHGTTIYQWREDEQVEVEVENPRLKELESSANDLPCRT